MLESWGFGGGGSEWGEGGGKEEDNHLFAKNGLWLPALDWF